MREKVLLYLAVALLACMLPACAVLTRSQVEEVRKFAQATQDYTILPGELATSYGILLREQKLLSVSGYRYGADSGGAVDTTRSQKAWEEIKNAYALEYDYKTAGKRMDAALDILKAYSNALGSVVSTESTEELGRCATNVGKSLDSAIESYNARFRRDAPLPKIGGRVGQIIRGAGGLYISHKQAKILKEAVQKADPLIQGLMADVEDIALGSFRPAFSNYEEQYLASTFQSVATNNKHVDMPLVSAVYDDLVRTRAGVALSDDVASAARAYAKAHHALVEKTSRRMDLKEAIEEIGLLNDELCAARRTRSAIIGN